MKDHWEKLGAEAHALKEHIEEMLEMAPKSARFYKLTGDINKAWTKFQKAMNDMDQFIAPVKSVEVKCAMLADAAFAETWAMWKDYLNEQHGLTMRSRAELMALKRIVDISENNAAKAVKYLEFAMGRIDKNFYKVNEVEIPADKPGNTQGTGKTIIKLPAKYQQQEENHPGPKGGLSNNNRNTKQGSL
jgi:hypothetical protein